MLVRFEPICHGNEGFSKMDDMDHAIDAREITRDAKERALCGLPESSNSRDQCGSAQ